MVIKAREADNVNSRERNLKRQQILTMGIHFIIGVDRPKDSHQLSEKP